MPPLDLETLYALPATPEPGASLVERARCAVARCTALYESAWYAPFVVAPAVTLLLLTSGACLAYAAGQISKVVGA